MCGICGIVTENKDFNNVPYIRTMMKTMKHRGPDDEGYYQNEKLSLGFVRLSIIDLSMNGHQPMFSPDQQRILIFNGEIYNYIELRDILRQQGHSFKTQTDTEVLLKAYEQWGEACLDKLNGMFAFVVYDRQQQKIFGARDRFGIKPFYYYLGDDTFIFASEINPILKILPRDLVKPNQQSIFEYLVYNRTDQTERTFFENIYKLPHGYAFTYQHKKLNRKKWYNLTEKCTTPFHTPEEYREQFTNSIKLRLRSDVPVGVCLSGGLDSSSIVSIFDKQLDRPDIATFSAIYGEGVKGDESPFIDLYKNSHHNMHFTWPDANTLLNDIPGFVRAHHEPIPSTSPYAQYKVMELASKNVVVTLDGQGADEQLAGYHYFFGLYFKELLRAFRLYRFMNEVYHYRKNHKSFYAIASMLFFFLPANMMTSARMIGKDYLSHSFYHSQNKNNVISGELYGSASLNQALFNHFEYKLEHLLKWEDQNSMFFGIESRVPFMDHHLVEKTLSLPDNQIIHKGTTKYILREAMKGILPEPIRNRHDKMGFVTPQDEWFRTKPFKKFIEDILHSSTFKGRNIVDVQKAIDLYRKHYEGKINIEKEIWKWIHLELWFREYIDKA